VCDLETSRIGAPYIYIYIYDISSLRVNYTYMYATCFGLACTKAIFSLVNTKIVLKEIH